MDINTGSHVAMTPAEYVNEIVLPTVREFRDGRRERRCAYLACIAVFSIKDHLIKAGEGKRTVEPKMRAALPIAFDVVRGVCNGTKHVDTDASHPIPFRAGDDRDRPPAFAGIMRAGRSRLGDIKGGRDIKVPGGRADLYECVKAVLLALKANYPGHLGSCDLSGL